MTRRKDPSRDSRRKLTDEQVLAIRADARPQREIAKDYPVHHTVIAGIQVGKGWAHLPGARVARPSRKLTDDEIRAIRKDPRLCTVIAKETKIGFMQVWRIKERLAWRNVPD